MAKIVVTAGSGRRDRVLVKPRVIVERARLSYLTEQGWTPDGSCYRGRFRTSHRAWWGEIQLHEGQLEFFIHDPPTELLRGPHSACFQHLGDNWWHVHFRRKPSDPSDGILEMERVLENPNQTREAEGEDRHVPAL